MAPGVLLLLVKQRDLLCRRAEGRGWQADVDCGVMIITTESYCDRGEAYVVRHYHPPHIGLEEARQQVEWPDGFRCQHEHDCCGHWYPRKATVEVKADGCQVFVVVTQKYYQNA